MSWVTELTLLHPPTKMIYWLTVNKLSEALRALGTLSIRVLSQQYEADLWTRRTYLLLNDMAICQTEVTATEHTYLKYQRLLDTLENQSIGDVLLHHPGTIRSNMEFAYLDQQWCRRSHFSVNACYHFMVMERFLTMPE